MNEKNRTAAMRVMEALSGIDEELLERCGGATSTSTVPARRGRTVGVVMPMWRWTRACAAVLCLMLVGAVSWGGYRTMKKVGSDGSYSGSANGAAPKSEDGLMESARDEYDLVEGGEMQQGAGGTVNGAGQPGADGCAPENGFPENYSGGSGESGNLPEMVPSGAGNDGLDETGDLSGIKVGSTGICELPETDCAVGLPNTVALSEEEARSWETLGDYLPTTLPQGYVFEGASYNQDTERLAMSWTRGMDLIIVSVGAAEDVETVDVGKPETYDERLYEIPYGSSVPREYWKSFDDPVFAVEDLDLEIVKSRILSHSDSGDTDTPRGDFSVLYPDGILLRFNGRGTPEQIWEMICSVKG